MKTEEPLSPPPSFLLSPEDHSSASFPPFFFPFPSSLVGEPAGEGEKARCRRQLRFLSLPLSPIFSPFFFPPSPRSSTTTEKIGRGPPSLPFFFFPPPLYQLLFLFQSFFFPLPVYARLSDEENISETKCPPSLLPSPSSFPPPPL